MRSNTIHLAWRDRQPSARFRGGVSLHSHTLHSEENLAAIIKLAHSIPGVAPLVRRQEAPL